MLRRFIVQMREHPLAFLAGLAFMGVEIAALWLLATRQAGSYTDPRGSAIVSGLEVLGFVFLLAAITIVPMAQAQSDERRRSSSSPLVVRIARLSIKWRIVGYVAWGALFLLALAQLVTAISGDLDHSSVLWGIMTVLNLAGILLVVAVRTSLPA